MEGRLETHRGVKSADADQVDPMTCNLFRIFLSQSSICTYIRGRVSLLLLPLRAILSYFFHCSPCLRSKWPLRRKYPSIPNIANPDLPACFLLPVSRGRCTRGRGEPPGRAYPGLPKRHWEELRQNCSCREPRARCRLRLVTLHP
jgi:hypothetical protein